MQSCNVIIFWRHAFSMTLKFLHQHTEFLEAYGIIAIVIHCTEERSDLLVLDILGQGRQNTPETPEAQGNERCDMTCTYSAVDMFPR